MVHWAFTRFGVNQPSCNCECDTPKPEVVFIWNVYYLYKTVHILYLIGNNLRSKRYTSGTLGVRQIWCEPNQLYL